MYLSEQSDSNLTKKQKNLGADYLLTLPDNFV